MIEEWVEGETSPRAYQLLSGGAAEDLTGMTVELVLTARDGTPVVTTGDITITDAATGTVTYAPDAGDLLAAQSPLTARFKVTDLLGRIAFFPTGVADQWVVRQP